MDLVVRLQENRNEADDHDVIVTPTVQFFKSETDYEKRMQYLPSQIEKPWHKSGLVGIHVDEVKKALRAVISKPASFWGLYHEQSLIFNFHFLHSLCD